MVRPRFALNVYGLGGVAFLVAGAVITAVGSAVDVRWLPLMGGGFALIGLLWTGLAGRMGRLRDPRLDERALPATVEVLAVKATSAQTSQGDHGPVTTRVYRIDLDVHCPAMPPYQLRIYRGLPPEVGSALQPGMDLTALVDPDDRRRVALQLHERARSDVDHLQAMQDLQRRWADPTT